MIEAFIKDDHRACDTLFARAEESASSGALEATREHFAKFRARVELHFAMEEEVLFPRFEEVTGHAGGPTAVMRDEHAQMRAVLADMDLAIEDGETAGFLDHAETLLVLTQQHNLKEEQILYPMMDEVLAGEAEALIERLRAMDTETA